jgi:hypothetical protein
MVFIIICGEGFKKKEVALIGTVQNKESIAVKKTICNVKVGN